LTLLLVYLQQKAQNAERNKPDKGIKAILSPQKEELSTLLLPLSNHRRLWGSGQVRKNKEKLGGTTYWGHDTTLAGTETKVLYYFVQFA
jgi:hypothetical protein